RRDQSPDHGPSPAPERREHRPGCRGLRRRRGDPRRVRAELPRVRSPGAAGELGEHAEWRARHVPEGAVARLSARSDDLPHRSVRRTYRGRPAGRPRPTGQVTMRRVRAAVLALLFGAACQVAPVSATPAPTGAQAGGTLRVALPGEATAFVP